MNHIEIQVTSIPAIPSALRRWIKLGLGLGVIWVTAYVLLPWAQALSPVHRIINTITEADIDAGTYWYTQSEETARAQMYVRNAIRKQR
jgi:hypothetical protein